MTGKTHQAVALAAVTVGIVVTHPPVLGVVGTLLLLAATTLGALTPDIDHPSSRLWRQFPASSVVSSIARQLLGGHRNMTHSLLFAYFLLRYTHGIVAVVRPEFTLMAETVWRAYIVGFLSHLVADTMTDRGVPWLWPLPWHVGIPPGPDALRITTGSTVERRLLLPALSVFTVVLWARYWQVFRLILGL